MPDTRETVKCRKCGLHQFRRKIDECVRCGTSTTPPPPPDPPPPPAVTEPITSLPTTGGEFLLIAMRITLKKERIRAGLSQRQLATKMKCVRTHIAKFEQGKVMPTLDSMQKLAWGLGISLGPFVQMIDDRASIQRLYSEATKIRTMRKAEK